jgi:hypothetical protein
MAGHAAAAAQQVTLAGEEGADAQNAVEQPVDHRRPSDRVGQCYSATVAAAASVTADPRHAVVLVFVNQTVLVGSDAPADTTSAVRVTLDKTGGRWLVSQFDPI